MSNFAASRSDDQAPGSDRLKDPARAGNFDELRRRAAALEGLRNAVGAVNPRPPGWHNGLIQAVKRLLARFLGWYLRPLYEFNSSVSRSLEEAVWAVDHLTTSLIALDHPSLKRTFEHLSVDIVDLEEQLGELKKRSAGLADPKQEQLHLLHERMKVLVDLQKTANRTDASHRVDGVFKDPEFNDQRQSLGGFGMQWQGVEWKFKTTYIIGLFGTGRRYINDLMLQNIGERAKYFRDTIRLHPGPTPMIYSGHVTMKHPSRAQEGPAIMRYILEAVRSQFADVIFVYRHPLDSLLTNWVWWRTYLRDKTAISGISQVYRSADDLCADLDSNFIEFKAFAEGSPDFFAAAPGPRFLSFSEFVEETELHLQSATLALRLEDFVSDPGKEFSKILQLMSSDVDVSRLSLALPTSKPYGHLGVQEKVPQFRNFIQGLDPETKRRIEKLGYTAI